MEKNVTVKWAGKLTFIGQAGSGDTVTMDAGTGSGGLGLGHSPMDLLLIGAGGCASIDIIMILQKGRQDVTDCICQVGGDRAAEHPRRYTDIHMHFIITGKDLKKEVVERAVTLSMDKYCSVSATLGQGANINYDFEVIEG